MDYYYGVLYCIFVLKLWNVESLSQFHALTIHISKALMLAMGGSVKK